MSIPIHLKQKIVEERISTGTSYKDLEKRFFVASETIRGWVIRYDGSSHSLEKIKPPGRPPIVPQEFLHDTVLPFVLSKNKNHQFVDSKSLIQHFNFNLSQRTMNNYNKKMGLSYKKTKKRKILFNEEFSCEDVVETFRKETVQFHHSQIFVFDEKNFLSNSIPHYGLSYKGTTPYINVEKETFPFRVDLLHGCGVDGMLGTPCLMTPEIRKDLHVKGFSAAIVLEWMEEEFLPAIEKKRMRNSVLMFDQSRAHPSKQILDLFEEKCPETAGGILIQPAGLAKYISPLDNGVHAIMERIFRAKLHHTDMSVKSMLECIEECYLELEEKRSFFKNFYSHCQIGVSD